MQRLQGLGQTIRDRVNALRQRLFGSSRMTGALVVANGNNGSGHEPFPPSCDARDRFSEIECLERDLKLYASNLIAEICSLGGDTDHLQIIERAKKFCLGGGEEGEELEFDLDDLEQLKQYNHYRSFRLIFDEIDGVVWGDESDVSGAGAESSAAKISAGGSNESTQPVGSPVESLSGSPGRSCLRSPLQSPQRKRVTFGGEQKPVDAALVTAALNLIAVSNQEGHKSQVGVAASLISRSGSPPRSPAAGSPTQKSTIGTPSSSENSNSPAARAQIARIATIMEASASPSREPNASSSAPPPNKQDSCGCCVVM